MLEWESERFSKIRKKHTTKTRGKKSGTRIVKEIFATEYAIRREAYAPIWEAIEKFSDLNLSYSFLHTFVLGLTNMSSPGSSRVYMVTSPNDPIEETGIYIKYDTGVSGKEMADLMKQAKESYETLFKITHSSRRTHDKDGRPFIERPKLKIRQRKMDAPTDKQLKMYLAIEKYLKENYIKSPDSIKLKTVFADVAGKLKINPGSLQRSYYAILDNFHLPTSVHTRKISG
jgi:hypothetical protein